MASFHELGELFHHFSGCREHEVVGVGEYIRHFRFRLNDPFRDLLDFLFRVIVRHTTRFARASAHRPIPLVLYTSPGKSGESGESSSPMIPSSWPNRAFAREPLLIANLKSETLAKPRRSDELFYGFDRFGCGRGWELEQIEIDQLIHGLKSALEPTLPIAAHRTFCRALSIG